MTRSWAIEAKFDGSTWTDISSYVRQVSVRRGRATDLDVVEPGVLNIELDNQDGRFTPENTQGAYTPDVKPGVPVRVSVTGGAASTTYRLFTGEVQRWEPVWTVGGLPLVMLEAVDGFEKLQNFAVEYALRQDILDNDPDAYWTLGGTSLFEETGQTDLTLSALAGATVGTGSSSIVTGGRGSIEDTGDEVYSPLAESAWTGAANDVTWVQAIRFTNDTPDTDPAGEFNYLCGVTNGAQDRGWVLYIDGHKLNWAFIDSTPATVTLSSPVLSWSADTTYLIGVVWDVSTKTVTFYRNGTSVGTDTAATIPQSAVGRQLFVFVGGASSNNTLLHSDVAVWSSDQSSIMSTLNSAVTGHPGDLPGARIGRVLDWAGWDASDRNIDTGTTSLAAVSSGTALSACQDAASADGGVFYIAKAGDATFQGRRGRWEDAAGTEYVDEYSDTYGTVGGSVFEFDDDGTDTGYRAVGWRYDTTLLSNHVTVNSNTQGVSDGVAEDATSQSTYGKRTLTVNTISNDTDDNAERAVWELSRRKDPHLRVEEVRTLVADVGREDVAGIVELQDRVDVNRRPGAGQDDITAEMRVADIAHEISEGGTRWELTVGLLDASTDQPGVWDDFVWGDAVWGY